MRNINAAEPNSPLRFGAIALGQQASIWLRAFGTSLKFALRADFRYPQGVIKNVLKINRRKILWLKDKENM